MQYPPALDFEMQYLICGRMMAECCIKAALLSRVFSKPVVMLTCVCPPTGMYVLTGNRADTLQILGALAKGNSYCLLMSTHAASNTGRSCASERPAAPLQPAGGS